MSKISKESADAIATKLTEKKRKEYDQSVDNLRAFCVGLCEKKIPASVMEVYEKNKGYFRVINSVQLIGNGADYDCVSVSSKLPSWNNSWQVQISLNAAEGKQFVKLDNEMDRLKKEVEELHHEIKHALLSLGTYKRIQAEFKEAAAFLPVRDTMSLVVDVKKIREKLK